MWSWRCQWSTITITAVVLVIYIVAANTWLIHPSLPRPVLKSPSCEPGIHNSSYPDDPLARLNLRLGRWDLSRSFRMFDNAAVGDLYSEISSDRSVCLATQSSIERLHELLRIAAHWTGPMSVAVFVAGDEMALLRGFATWLFRCSPEVYSRIAFHVATPADRPATLGDMPIWARDCNGKPLPLEKSETLWWSARHPYPQNHMRNLARKNCHTSYVFLVDVDIVPSKGMSEALDKFLSATPKCGLCAYVVPTYELDERLPNFPSNKSELVTLSQKKLAIPFHRKVFLYNQNATNFSKWEATGGNESSESHISHDVTLFEEGYEPFYVAADTVPPHPERFQGYGFTRNTQVLEMFLMGYQFRVLSPIFTIHWGLQDIRDRPSSRGQQSHKNFESYMTYKSELVARYGERPLHWIRQLPQKNLTVLTASVV